MIRILTNGYLRTLRDRSNRPVGVDLDPDDLADEPWAAIDWGLCGPQLLAEVDRLPEEYRLAVVLCDIEELSYEEAAAAMEVALGTAKSRLYRGRRILRARLAGLVEEENASK